MKKILAGLLLLALRMSVAQGVPASSEVKAEALSLQHLAGELLPQFGKLRFHREEEFEDQLHPPGPSAAPVPHLFRVQQDPSGDVIRTGGIPTMYIAVSQDGAAIYRLSGFPDAELHFNDLIRTRFSAQIRSKSQAEARGLLCAEIVYGASPAWWIGDASNVQMQVAQHFFSEGHRDGMALAARWWKAAKGDRTALKIVTLAKDGGYEVNLPVMWAPVETHIDPEVKLYRVQVSATGMCSMPVAPSVILR